jgi:hypothetical protein
MTDMQKRLMAAAMAMLMTGGLVACGGGDSGSAPTPVPTPPPRAVVTFNVDPNPVVSEDQGDGWYRFKVNLEFFDTAGVGFTINTVRTEVTEPVAGTILLDYNYVVASHVDARGRKVLQFTSPLYWTLAGGGARIRFVADLRDDQGNPMTLSNQATVRQVGGPKAELQ